MSAKEIRDAVPKAEDDTQSAFCEELDNAIGDEGSAQTEYARLEALARGNNMDNEAEAIDMIEKQEASHQKFFQKLKEREC